MYTLCILHGWGQDRQSWLTFADQFSEYNPIIMDLPGFGDEPLISDEWGITDYATWVEARIKALNLTKVIILGHSFGGRIASYLAAKEPHWLHALILYGAPCIYRPSRRTRYKIALYKSMKRIGIKLRSHNPELSDADRLGLGKVFRKVVNFDQTATLTKISIPTLLIWGEQDTEVPLRIAREIQELITKSELIVLDNLGHNAHLENPALFYGVIQKYTQNL